MSFILLLGVLLISGFAYKTKKLTRSGAVAAVVVGTFIALGLGLYGLLLLALFFLSSTLVGLLRRKHEQVGEEISAKGDCRDAFQVLANGGVAALLSLIYLIIPSPMLICGFIASIAAANADTWASEIGSLSKSQPFHMIKWRRVPAGTSGAMSTVGTAAAFAGSFVISVLSIFFWLGSHYNSHILLIALIVCGFVGNLFDTLLGGTGQVVYRCPVCGLETERKKHCDTESKRIYGLTWMNNDIVNLCCSAIGAILGIVTGSLFL
ncbi:DUF92 domain-containing protein [bacterium LRH843]|nr:DUF92 domain-containing protein [bacterium LRH843]